MEGGDVPKTVRELAEEGFIAYAKTRSGTSISTILDEVQDGLAELMNLTSTQLGGRSIVSGSNDLGVSLIGCSRVVLMSLGVAELQVDGNGASKQIDKVVVMAMGWVRARDGPKEGRRIQAKSQRRTNIST